MKATIMLVYMLKPNVKYAVITLKKSNVAWTMMTLLQTLSSVCLNSQKKNCAAASVERFSCRP